ncbi:MAG: DUF4388 domain-containing protein [Acidimicrobiales bacterium]|nr:DUF4388 domain-containing protein [Acidimicrobiales bacterium]
MSLQGTLDTFPLDDVLQLLAGTRKTGRLEVSGSRVAGSIWTVDGAVVAAVSTSLPSGAPVAEAVFEILSYREGAFVFEAGVAHPGAGPPIAVDALLTQWEDEQRALARPDAWVTLAHEAPAAQVDLSADEWRLVATIGGGIEAGAVAARLGASAMETARALRRLLDSGLLVMSDGASPPVIVDARDVATRPAAAAAPAPAPAPAAPAPAAPAPAPAAPAPAAPAPAPAAPAPAAPALAPLPAQAPPAPSPELGGDLGIVIPGFDSLLGEAASAAPGSGAPPPEVAAPPAGAAEPRPEPTPSVDAPAGEAPAGEGGGEEAPPDRELLLRYLSSVKR